jgi:hypothetical protein
VCSAKRTVLRLKAYTDAVCYGAAALVLRA